jgi:NAD kinase
MLSVPSAEASESLPQAVTETVVFFKQSRVERDLKKIGGNVEALQRHYTRQAVPVQEAFASHARQQAALAALRKLLPRAHYISAEWASRAALGPQSLVIALGGDNHFQRVAALVDSQVMLGINSDPERSVGALAAFTIDSYAEAVSRQHISEAAPEHWTRLDVRLNGVPLVHRALCEVFLGERERPYMSRHVLHLGEQSEEQKSSGLLVATGAGATGWYAAARGDVRWTDETFAKTEESFRFIATEPHPGARASQFLHGQVSTGEALRVVSLNRRNGVLAVDAFRHHPFPSGALAEISVGKPLRVISAPRP